MQSPSNNRWLWGTLTAATVLILAAGTFFWMDRTHFQRKANATEWRLEREQCRLDHCVKNNLRGYTARVEPIEDPWPNLQFSVLDGAEVVYTFRGRHNAVFVQIKDVLFGSEGNFGLITRAVLKIRPKPEVSSYQSLVFPDSQRGVAFLFELANSSILPASIRLVDNLQFRFGLALKPASGRRARARSLVQQLMLRGIKRIDPKQMVVATIGMEGSKTEVQAQHSVLSELAARHHGFFAGASNGKRGYHLTFAIAYIRDFMTTLQVLGETLETTLPWDRIHTIIESVRAEAQRVHREYRLPGKPFLSYRITQLYASGACVYFTYGIYTKGVDDPGAVASRAEDRLRQTIVRHGGAVSNHHGVGKLRSALLGSVLPPLNAEMIRALKTTIDPRNVFGAQNGVFLRGFGRPEAKSE